MSGQPQETPACNLIQTLSNAKSRIPINFSSFGCGIQNSSRISRRYNVVVRRHSVGDVESKAGDRGKKQQTPTVPIVKSRTELRF